MSTLGILMFASSIYSSFQFAKRLGLPTSAQAALSFRVFDSDAGWPLAVALALMLSDDPQAATIASDMRLGPTLNYIKSWPINLSGMAVAVRSVEKAAQHLSAEISQHDPDGKILLRNMQDGVFADFARLIAQRFPLNHERPGLWGVAPETLPSNDSSERGIARRTLLALGWAPEQVDRWLAEPRKK
jgi:hypothetical protein